MRKEGIDSYEGGCEQYIDRAESQYEINTLLILCFEKKDYLNLKEYEEIVMKTCSDLFLCVYSTLKTHFPSLTALQRKENEIESAKGSLKCPSKGIAIPYPKILKKFLPISRITNHSQLILKNEESFPDSNTRSTQSDELINLHGDPMCQCGNPMADIQKRLCANCAQNRLGTRIEGFLMKYTRSKSEIAKFWVAVENQEIYCKKYLYLTLN